MGRLVWTCTNTHPVHRKDFELPEWRRESWSQASVDIEGTLQGHVRELTRWHIGPSSSVPQCMSLITRHFLCTSNSCFHYYCVWFTHTHAMLSHVHDQRTACRSRSLPLGFWRSKSRCQGYMAKAFTHQAVLPVHVLQNSTSILYIKGLKMCSLYIKGFSNSKYYFIVILFIAWN